MRAIRSLLAVTASVATFGSVLLAPAASAAPAPASNPVPWPCPSGSVCFYTKHNGSGQRCYTDASISRWVTPSCNEVLFQSYFNNGKPGSLPHVYAHRGYDHTGTQHNLLNGERGGLASDANPRGVKIRSVAWHKNN